MEVSRDTVEISVVIYHDEGLWIAQGIEHDIAAHGEDPVEASERFNTKVGAELVVSMELGDATLLSGIARAPAKFEEMYRKAKMRIVDEDVPLPVTEGTRTLRFRPHNQNQRRETSSLRKCQSWLAARSELAILLRAPNGKDVSCGSPSRGFMPLRDQS